MNVFRIQDVDGRGPWRPGFSSWWVESREDHKNLRPWYEEFGWNILKKRKMYEYAGSACISTEQLRRWFTKSEYETLLKFEYRCVKMKIDRILAKSDIQCFFVRRKPLYFDFDIVELY